MGKETAFLINLGGYEVTKGGSKARVIAKKTMPSRGDFLAGLKNIWHCEAGGGLIKIPKKWEVGKSLIAHRDPNL